MKRRLLKKGLSVLRVLIFSSLFLSLSSSLSQASGFVKSGGKDRGSHSSIGSDSSTNSGARKNNSAKKTIAIVGGGLAGTTALYRLQKSKQKEFTVTLFEATDRLGGRVLDIDNKFFPESKLDGGPMFVDSVGQEAMTDLMKDLGWDLNEKLVSAWSTEHTTLTYEFFFNEQLNDEQLNALFTENPAYVSALKVLRRHKRLSKEQSDDGAKFRKEYLNVTAEEYLNRLPTLASQELKASVQPHEIKWLTARLKSRWASWGTSLKDFTSLEIFSYIDVYPEKEDEAPTYLDLTGGHDEANLIRGGTYRLIEALVEKINFNDKRYVVKFQHKVIKVGQCEGGKHAVLVQAADGAVNRQCFDKVILAVPAYLIGSLLEGNPTIPADLFTEFKNINYGQVAKIFLHYRNEPWFLNNHSGTLYFEDAASFPLDNGASPKGDHVLIAYLSGKMAQDYNLLTPEEKNKYVENLVKKFEKLWPGGDYIGYQDIYWPKAYWVSNNATAFAVQDHERGPIGGIYFTGDYFSEHNGSYMAGAVESAERAVKHLLK